MKSEIYNVGLSNANLSKKELCEIIKLKIIDLNIIINDFNKDPDQRNYIVSNDKLEKTGFIPKISISEGIDELIKGYKYFKKIILEIFNLNKIIKIFFVLFIFHN